MSDRIAQLSPMLDVLVDEYVDRLLRAAEPNEVRGPFEREAPGPPECLTTAGPSA